MKEEQIPFVAFGNGELESRPVASEGDLVNCTVCGGTHPLRCATNTETGEKTDTLMFYTCGDKSYLGAVAGKLVV